MKKMILFALTILLCQAAEAQYQIGLVPRTSPDKAVYQKIGLTDIEVKYGSPSVKSRKIWGELVPYQKTWRAGANNATTIEFSTDISINNQIIKAGKYAFFIIPQKDKKWVAILNKDVDQWGSFNYKPNDDIIRIEVLPRKTNSFTEDLNYQIQNYGFEFGEITLSWEYLQLSIEFTTNYTNEFEKVVEERIQKAGQNVRWVIYLQGAEHLDRINSNPELAQKWIGQSESLLKDVREWNPQYYPKEYIEGHLYWVKAKILAQQKEFEEAIKYAEKMKMLGDKKLFYNKKMEVEKIDEKIDYWKTK